MYKSHLAHASFSDGRLVVRTRASHARDRGFDPRPSYFSTVLRQAEFNFNTLISSNYVCTKKLDTFSIDMSSLCRGHANLLCIVPILVDVPEGIQEPKAPSSYR